jgi:hypothetical protein
MKTQLDDCPPSLPDIDDIDGSLEALPLRLIGRADWLAKRGRIKDMELMYDAASEIKELRRALTSAMAAKAKP